MFHWCFLTCNCTKAKNAQREAELEKEEQKRKIYTSSKDSQDYILQSPALQNGPLPVCTTDIFSGMHDIYTCRTMRTFKIVCELSFQLPSETFSLKKKCISLYA
jgi:hypothetical protein